VEKSTRAVEATDDDITWSIRKGCWITKATNTFSEYIIFIIILKKSDFAKELQSKGHNTRWFKYDRDDLCVNKSQFIPVIFETPCTLPVSLNYSPQVHRNQPLTWKAIQLSYKTEDTPKKHDTLDTVMGKYFNMTVKIFPCDNKNRVHMPTSVTRHIYSKDKSLRWLDMLPVVSVTQFFIHYAWTLWEIAKQLHWA
jgi:hypothetical protein